MDNESKARKKAEQERDRLDHQFQLLRKLILETDGVDEGTLRRVKILEDPTSVAEPSHGYPNILSPGLMSLREGLSKPSKRRSANMTEESVLDVEDLNLCYVEAANLCDESRGRLTQAASGEKKRSRSVTRREDVEEEQAGRVRKRGRRSRSVGICDRVEVLENTPYLSSFLQHHPRRQEHDFEEKTNIKTEKCAACKKRLKFGKKYFNCVNCRIIIHPECHVAEECIGRGLTSSPSTVSTNPSVFQTLSRTPSKKEQRSLFASPMLQ